MSNSRTPNNVNWIIGPPGTGKTTYLAEIWEDLDEDDDEDVLILTMTKAASHRFILFDSDFLENYVSTLHAHCYNVLGKPELAEANIKEWNELYPEYKLSVTSSKRASYKVFQSSQCIGDPLLQEMNRLRNRMTPIDSWPIRVREFAHLYDIWKKERGLIDFTGLIEAGIEQIDQALDVPHILLCDEFQDFSALELKLILKWGESAIDIYLAGDPDQSIYLFHGVEPLPNPKINFSNGNITILNQSYRIPSAVHQVACPWINRIRGRLKAEFKPRDVRGSVRKSNATYKLPQPIIDDIEEELQRNRSVMVLASCAHFLEPTIEILRERGILFHNPYRPSRHAWNPLSLDCYSDFGRLMAFFRPCIRIWGFNHRSWKYKEIVQWYKMLNWDIDDLPKDKRIIRKLLKSKRTIEETLHYFFRQCRFPRRLIEAALYGNIDYVRSRISPDRVRSYEYYFQLIEEKGIKLMHEIPKLVVGTIHSVKGGEADSVYLFPDLSRATMREWVNTGEGHDGIVRQFYVAMTRTRENLVICASSSSNTVEGLI